LIFGDTEVDYLWQFHVHHIIPEKAYDDVLVGQALEAAGFFQQAKGNKIALFASSETAAIARQSINSGSSFYLDAGFGGSVHPGRETGLSHKGYNDFALAQLEAIMLADPADRQAAFTKLHAFLTDVSEGRFANLGVESRSAALGSTWVDYDPSPAELSQRTADFDPTITDANGLSNDEERYENIRDQIEKAYDAGHLTEAQYHNHVADLGASVSKGPSHVSAVGVAATIDIQKNMGSIQPSAKSEFALLVTKFVGDQNASVPVDVFDRMMSSMDRLGDRVAGDFGARLPASLDGLGSSTVGAMATSMGSILAGIGGGAIGDVVEFLNASYESIKIGLDTNDWSSFRQNILTYGASAVISAAVVALSVAAAAEIGVLAASVVAAGWAAYGVYDALTNGIELIGKLHADWRDSDLGKLLTEFFDLPPLSPLVLDLDGDGVELVALQNSGTFFDLDADGVTELAGWVAADDALLAIDLDGDGRIDNGSELFGDQTGFAHGFLALAEHDSNDDGIIDAQDSTFAELLLWRDANGDGVSQSGELKTLAELGVASISLSATATNQQVAGHGILWQSGFTRTDGSTGTVSDVFFEIDPIRTRAVVPDGFQFDPDVFKLPVIQGAGQLPSTLIALSAQPALKAQFTALLAQAASGDIGGLLAGFEAFVYAWAGVANVEPDSRGPAMDARKVAFLEAILGRQYQQDDYAYLANPGPVAALMLDWEASKIIEAMAAQFLAQSTISHAQLTATSAATYEAAIAGHPLNMLPSVGDDAGSYDWVGEILADAASETGLTLAQAGTLLRIMRHEASDLGAYEQAIVHGYVSIGVAAGIAQQMAARLVAEDGYYVTDGPGDELVPDALMADHAVYVADPSGNDTLQGTKGDDVLVGREGNDTYVWGTGMGNDVTDEEGDADPNNTTDVDRLVLTNLTAEDVRFVRMIEPGFDMDLMIEVVDTGEWLLLDDQLSSYAFEAIEQIVFADGQVMLAAEFEQLARVWVDGTAADDVLTGPNIASGINGWSGNDVIDAGTGQDMLAGGSGNDTLRGGEGNDTYVYSRGDGHDSTTEGTNQGAADKVVLTDINPDDVALVRNGNNVTLLIGESAPGAGDGGSILLNENLDDYFDRGVEQIVFADGTTWARVDLRLRLLAQASTDGNDTIVGFNTGNTITGGLGNDTLRGEAGNDTYVYSRGDGHDSIAEGTNHGGADKLVLTDINPDDVSLLRNGNDVTLVIAESTPGAGDGGSIFLDENLDDYFDRGVEQIVFADGTTWARVDLRLRLLAQASTDGNDTIVGFNTGNTITGGLGNDTLRGEAGNDTYVYSRGDGHDSIAEGTNHGGADKLVLTDINPDDVSLLRNGNDVTLVIAESTPGAGDGGSIFLDENLDDYFDRGVEQIVFADGTVWSRATLRSMVLLGTSGNDIITGFSSNDYLNGASGNDTLDGGDGNDAVHGGDGNDVVRGGNGDDSHFGGNGDDVIYGSVGTDSFDGGAGKDSLNFDYTSAALTVDLANGSVSFETGQIEAAIDFENFTSGAGNDTLLGSAQGNTMRGGGGNDTINGAGGDDIIDGGDGDDSHFGGDGDDRLVANAGTDTFDGGDGVDTIDTTYYASNIQVDFASGTLTFANGVSESAINIENATTGAGNDVLVGSSGSNRLNSGDGNDALHGGDGDDILDGGAGLDSYFGGGGDDLLIGNLGADTFDGGNGNDTLELTYTSESVTANLTAGTVLFAGGTTETAVNIENLRGGSGNDTILGTSGSNVLGGGLGSDQLDGGSGVDTAIYSGARQDYSIVENVDGSFTITDLNASDGNEGTDLLTSIEFARFSDQDVVLAVEPIHQAIDGILSIPVGSTAQGKIQLTVPPGYDGIFEYSIIDDADHGSVSIGLDGTYSYAANPAYVGGDGFSVRIEDEFGGVQVATVAVFVRQAVTQSPVSFVNAYWRASNITTDADYWRMDPAISALEDGGYIVAWSQDGRDGSLSGVLARRYDIDGNALGSEFQVNTYATNDQSLADVAGLSGGGFVVTWTSTSQDGSNDGVYAQRYTSTGAKAGGEFRVNTTTADYQRRSTVAATDDGGFIVTWESNGQDGSDFGVYVRKYDSAGSAVTTELRVNTFATNWQRVPQVQELTDGKFVVVWDSNTQDGSGLGVYGQVFNADGSKFGNELQIHEYLQNAQREPQIAALRDGGFVVIWEDESGGFGAGSGTDIVGRLFSSDGVSEGPSFRINSSGFAGSQTAPTVAALPDGDFVVIWGDLSDGTIRGQRFDSLGQAEGSGIFLADYAINEAWRPEVSVLEDGGIALAWQFSETAGGRTAIRTTLLLGDHVGAVSGTAGADTIIGDDIRNTFDGGDGDDRLDGAGGGDWLTGGVGDDSFVFRGDFGSDEVEDFEIHAGGANGDVIEIHDQTGLTFADVIADAEQRGSDAYLDLGEGNSITLRGVAVSALTVQDFWFV